MSRHRSPQGRRASVEFPLYAVPAPAGLAGAHRSVSPPQLTSSLPVRFVATAVVGGALAAAGQHALAETLPAATDGANVLRLGVEEMLGGAGPDTSALGAAFTANPVVFVAEPLVAVVPEPLAVADATELVKAADLQRLAAESAARVAEEARVAEAARTEAARTEAARTEAARTEAAEVAAASAGRGVQMVAGRVTSGFGARWGSAHQGLDIAAPIGTAIRVPLDGTVVDSGPASGFGLWVRVEHEDGSTTVYGHINRSLVDVGDRVDAGDVIAEVGNRGKSTGPHLHFEVTTPGGTKINPRPWLDDLGIDYQA